MSVSPTGHMVDCLEIEVNEVVGKMISNDQLTVKKNLHQIKMILMILLFTFLSSVSTGNASSHSNPNVTSKPFRDLKPMSKFVSSQNHSSGLQPMSQQIQKPQWTLTTTLKPCLLPCAMCLVPKCPTLECPQCTMPKCRECPSTPVVVQEYILREKSVEKEECVFVKKIKPLFRIAQEYPNAPPPKCRSIFSMYYVNLEPYSGLIFRDILQETVLHCCWELKIDPKIHFVPASNLSTIIQDNLKEKILEDNRFQGDQVAHFIFPVLGHTKATRMHGHYFIPLFSPPGAFYVTRRHGIDTANLIQQCVELWPLLLMTIAMAAIAGFIAWICETKKNTDEFPREFFRGWFEGTWWSFISMTTVGYGDKTPRSIAGRCFSVAWILSGIIVFNILAGELTSVIMQAKMVGRVSMAEQKVGTLDRTYEKSLVVENGGILVATAPDQSNDTQQFYHLIKDLKFGKIDGFLLDKYTYRSFKDKLLSQIEDKSIANFFLLGTMLTDIEHSGDDLSYGVLIKYSKRYDYFKPMFESNKIAFKATISQYLNHAARNSTSQKESELMSENLHLDVFKKLRFVYFLIPVGVIVFFGVSFEVIRKKQEEGIEEKDTEGFKVGK